MTIFGSFERFVAALVDRQDAARTLLASGLLVSLVVGAVTFRNVRTKRSDTIKKPWQFLPGCLPIIGHVHLTGSLKEIVPKCEAWAKQHAQNVGCYEMQLFGRRFIMISSEERAMEILKHRPFVVVRPAQVGVAMRSIGAKFLFEAEGDDWKREHRLVAPALNKANVNEYLSVFRTMSDRLVKKWSTAADSGLSVRIEPDLRNLTADTIAKVTMDKDFDFLGTDSLVSRDVMKMLRGFVSRSMAPFPYWDIPVVGQFLDGLGWSIHRVVSLVGQVVTQYGGLGDGAPKRTFLQKVYSLMHSNNETLSRQRLGGNVLGLFLAGTDTTSNAVLTAMYIIATDSDLQTVLKLEADNVDLDLLTLQDLYAAIPRIKSMLHEVHRWYGSPIHGLSTTQDIPFCGTTLPKGTDVMILSRCVSWQSDDVPRGPSDSHPSLFDPARYLVTDANGVLASVYPNTKLGGFMAFGHGVRACPGRSYSEALSYVTLVAVLQNFTFTPTPGHIAERFIYNGMIVPDCDVQLTLSKRHAKGN